MPIDADITSSTPKHITTVSTAAVSLFQKRQIKIVAHLISPNNYRYRNLSDLFFNGETGRKEYLRDRLNFVRV